MHDYDYTLTLTWDGSAGRSEDGSPPVYPNEVLMLVRHAAHLLCTSGIPGPRLRIEVGTIRYFLTVARFTVDQP